MRLRVSLLIVLGILLALVAAVILRQKAPPECARLLPESDAIVYLNVKMVRRATRFDRTLVKREDNYQRFVDATGFVFERDLDEVAFAIHRLPDPHGPNGPVAYSEVFEGRFDGPRLTQYLASIATSKEDYTGHEIYCIPVEGRTLRVAILGYDLVTASNMPTPEQIHSILDRYHAAALPFSGSSLLSAQYSKVPLLSVAWGIGRIGLPFGSGSSGNNVELLGLTLPVPTDTTFIASLRFVGSLRLRVEELAPNDAEAAQSTETLKSLLAIYQSVQEHLNPETGNASDADFRELVDSLKIEQEKSRMVVTASIPLDLMKRTLASSHEAAPAPSSGK